MIDNNNRKGAQDINLFSASESITLKLPRSFQINSNYSYINQNQFSQKSSQNRIQTNLQHQLYNSLNSNIDYEYYKINHSSYKHL